MTETEDILHDATVSTYRLALQALFDGRGWLTNWLLGEPGFSDPVSVESDLPPAELWGLDNGFVPEHRPARAFFGNGSG